MILIPRLFNILQMAPVKTWTGPYQTENQTEVNKKSITVGCYLE